MDWIVPSLPSTCFYCAWLIWRYDEHTMQYAYWYTDVHRLSWICSEDADVGELPEVPITFQIYLLTYGKTVMISKISLCVLHPILGDLQSVSVIPVLPHCIQSSGRNLMSLMMFNVPSRHFLSRTGQKRKQRVPMGILSLATRWLGLSFHPGKLANP